MKNSSEADVCICCLDLKEISARKMKMVETKMHVMNAFLFAFIFCGLWIYYQMLASHVLAMEQKIVVLQRKQDEFMINSVKKAAQSEHVTAELNDKINDLLGQMEEYRLELTKNNEKSNYFEETSDTSIGMGLQNSKNTDQAYIKGDNYGSKRALFETEKLEIGERCRTIPLLSPLNNISNFTFDTRVEHILSTLHSISTLMSLNDIYSPQYKAACWVLYDDKLQLDKEDNLLIQRYVFATFLFAIHQEDILLNMTSPCDLGGLLCDEENRITSINMTNMTLDGFIPNEIAVLPVLVTLDLSHNNIKGTIPAGLGRLKSLKTICLDHNSFRGTIPTEIGMMFNLSEIKLESNKITGSIPSELGKLEKLTFISFFNNLLIGTIPAIIFNNPLLERLELFNNNLSGSLPINIHLSKSLEILKLSNNELVGSIPSEIGGLSSLVELWLRSNQMTGPLPAQLGLLQSIKRIVIEGNKFTGMIPDMFSNLSELAVFNIESNELAGNIPDSIWNVKFGVALFLDDNNLRGTVPTNFCAMKPPIFRVDSSSWFLDNPKIDCSCCETASCYFWKTNEPMVGGTIRPSCPINNIKTIPFFERNSVTDTVSSTSTSEFIGPGIKGQLSLCLSPTGCFSFTTTPSTDIVSPWKYSSSEKGLIEQEVCEAVRVCDQEFHWNHPKRKALNHITQLVIYNLTLLEDESSPEYEALCLILEDDDALETYDICDGTLLQRFIMALFFFKNKDILNTSGLSQKNTCEWEGITCSNGKYVNMLNYSDSRLHGTLMTEFGQLTALQVLEIGHNNISGEIHESLFLHTLSLQVFNATSNNLRGEIPQVLFEAEQLKSIDLTDNKLTGSLPNDIKYAPTLEIIHVGKNLLKGSIPDQLKDCENLTEVDLSSNTFIGGISTIFGELKHLKELRLDRNRLTGSIPAEIFNSIEIEIFMLQFNILTGTIPSEIQKLKNVKTVTLGHNLLKGAIPKEFGLMEELETLQLNNNRFTGEAPHIERLKNRQKEYPASYITDCGDPQFLVSEKLVCDSCTICCNSLGKCQKQEFQTAPVFIWGYIVFGIVPPAILLSLYIIRTLIDRKKDRSARIRNSLSIHNENSVFCLIFSSNWLGWLVYFLMMIIQSLAFSIFLEKTAFAVEDTEWAFTMRCVGTDNLDCDNEKNVTAVGWFLFWVVTFSFLGRDLVDSLLQLQKAVHIRDRTFLLSGSIHCYLTTLAFYTSFRYNMALAESNTDLIVNAVILLFINELDESVLNILDSAVPYWIADRYEEIEENLKSKRGINEKDDQHLRRNVLNGAIIPSIEFRMHELEESIDDDSIAESDLASRDSRAKRFESGLRMLGLKRKSRRRLVQDASSRRMKLESKLSAK